jgi:hypothetical protein
MEKTINQPASQPSQPSQLTKKEPTMNAKQFNQKSSQKRQKTIFNDYQDFYTRLKINSWDSHDKDWKIRINALIQFHPNHKTNAIIHRATLSTSAK